MLATIVTTRLSIEAVIADDLDTLLAGCTESNRIRIPVVWLDDDPAERETITFIAPRMRNEPGLTPWRFRLIVRREDATMIGHIGFHDVPTAGRLELVAVTPSGRTVPPDRHSITVSFCSVWGLILTSSLWKKSL